MLDADADAEM